MRLQERDAPRPTNPDSKSKLGPLRSSQQDGEEVDLVEHLNLMP